MELYREIEWVDPAEVRAIFHEDYEVASAKPVEIDDDLGLEIVQKESLEQKYGVTIDPRNDFHNSLKEQFDSKGYLSKRQIDCLRNPRY